MSDPLYDVLATIFSINMALSSTQALLANISAMYAVYHGPEGIRNIATNIHKAANFLVRFFMLWNE